MKTFLKTTVALLTFALVSGCAETMPKQKTEQPEQVIMQDILKETKMEEQNQQQDAVGIVIEIGKTSVIPFIQLLGKPQSEHMVSEERGQIAWVTQRLLTGKKDEKPVVVVLPASDPRVGSLPMQILAIQANKVDGVWMVEGLKLGPVEKKEEPAK